MIPQVPLFPNNFVVFPHRDFLTVEGFLVGIVFRIERDTLQLGHMRAMGASSITLLPLDVGSTKGAALRCCSLHCCLLAARWLPADAFCTATPITCHSAS